MRIFWGLTGLTMLATTVFASPVVAEPVQIPTYEQPRPPLVIFENGRPTGIYNELFRAILNEAGIVHTLVPAPKLRARIMFEKGESFVACCANPSWRTRPQEQMVQIFSEPFHVTEDIFVFPHGRRFAIEELSKLSDKIVATVRGFGYRGENWFGERIALQNEEALLQFVAKGRADVGIVNAEVFKLWSVRNPQQVDKGEIHDFASLHLRLHRNRKELLGPINKAIKDLIKSGRRDQIIEKFLSLE